MKTVLVFALLALGGLVAAQQEKPVPKDSTRIFINGCAKGQAFTAGAQMEDLPGRSDIQPGSHFRLNGSRQIMSDIKAHKGTMIEITGLIKKGQFEPGGIALGGHVRVGAASPIDNNPTRSAMGSQMIMIDVESWRPLVGSCPE